jgi:hypothetical protein
MATAGITVAVSGSIANDFEGFGIAEQPLGPNELGLETVRPSFIFLNVAAAPLAEGSAI